jgi:hypothetical protein
MKKEPLLLANTYVFRCILANYTQGGLKETPHPDFD